LGPGGARREREGKVVTAVACRRGGFGESWRQLRRGATFAPA
jgi:hypothetical protein